MTWVFASTCACRDTNFSILLAPLTEVNKRCFSGVTPKRLTSLIV